MYELVITKKYIEDSKFKFPYGLPVTSTEVAECAGMEIIGNEDQECALAFFLDSQNTVVGFSNIARGAIDRCLIDLRIILRNALLCPGVCNIIICHCHPSGNVAPSSLDDDVVKKLYVACEIVGLKLIDSIIVGPNGTSYSYDNTGRMRQIRLSSLDSYHTFF